MRFCGWNINLPDAQPRMDILVSTSLYRSVYLLSGLLAVKVGHVSCICFVMSVSWLLSFSSYGIDIPKLMESVIIK